jgi:hypothetical protein
MAQFTIIRRILLADLIACLTASAKDNRMLDVEVQTPLGGKTTYSIFLSSVEREDGSGKNFIIKGTLVAVQGGHHVSGFVRVDNATQHGSLRVEV